MKKIKFLFLFLITIYSCTDDMFVQNMVQFDAEYIKLEEDTFVLTIDRANAAMKNIPSLEYKSLEEETRKANEILQRIISDFKKDSTIKRIYIGSGDSDVYYEVYEGKYTKAIEFDRDTVNNHFLLAVKRRSEGPYDIPKGWIETFDSSISSDSHNWAPNGLKGVGCSCQAKAALSPIHFVSTQALGSAITKQLVGNGQLNVPLDASNTYFTVSYATTDSNGGRCSWSGY